MNSSFSLLRALITSELEEVFSNAPIAPNSLANAHVMDAYARATGKAVPSKASSSSGVKKRIPEPGSECPICYEDMHGVAEKLLVFCETCGNGLHKQCFGECK